MSCCVVVCCVVSRGEFGVLWYYVLMCRGGWYVVSCVVLYLVVHCGLMRRGFVFGLLCSFSIFLGV